MSSPRVLVIDDESMLLKVVTRLLERSGCQVQTAPDGATAIEIYQKDPLIYDLVIIDYVLPGLSSEATLQKMQAINPKLKAIISTGFAAEEKMREYASLGVIGALQKPFSLEDLQKLLKSIF
jgi:two-component system cell cycle sensor histidine kinase/response regulator CckA